ncbi:uncharacterized protein LOC129569294 [Sitodiplosis mosellana]|uniref:uncharacterized protein LOC129569294 n=1 Tax=Sitodiplosis mosellana TaxID=263140 RepID=UPI00244537A9|nr:uncharacterized protein LOC129569294 [Sitodiplosis mosellana]
MDTDCVICFRAHLTSDCPDKKPQHCPDCFNFIRRLSNHSQICGNKAWYFKPFEDVYVKPLIERFIIGCNNAFRFLTDNNWRKTGEEIEMYSPQSDAVLRFKTDLDLAILTTSFTPIRVVVVVKQDGDKNETFHEKLMLSTSKDQMIIGSSLDEPFDPTTQRQHSKTTLVLGMVARENLCLTVYRFPLGDRHEIRYDTTRKMFRIPDALIALTAELAERARNASDVESRSLDRCYECHTPIRHDNDHVKSCSFKNRFRSDFVDRYIRIPAIRYIVSANTKIFHALDQCVQQIQVGIDLFSAAADVCIKPMSSSKFAVLTPIRMPIVLKEKNNNLVEKIVFLTSSDRTVVAVHSGRAVSVDTVLKDFEHNTPAVLFLREGSGVDLSLSIEVFGASGTARSQIAFDDRHKNYVIPSDLDVRSRNWPARPFDADIKKFN